MTLTPVYHPDSKLDLQRNYINGRSVANESGDTFSTVHPSNGQIIGQIENAGQTEVNAAVAAASAAFIE